MGEGRNTRDRYFIIPSPIKTKTMTRSSPTPLLLSFESWPIPS